MAMLFSDAFRLIRSRALWAGMAFVVLLSLYTAFSLLAQMNGTPLPQFTMAVVGTEPEPEAMLYSTTLTGAIGASALGAGLLPFITSVVMAFFAYDSVKDGFDAYLLSSGISRASLVREQFTSAVLISAVMLAANALPYAALYALFPPVLLEHAPITELACWLGLVIIHTSFYAFLTGVVVILTRRRIPGLLCAVFVSLGAIETMITALVDRVTTVSAFADFLPLSIAKAISSGAVALDTPYFASMPLLPVALAVYVVAIVGVGVLAILAYRKRSMV